MIKRIQYYELSHNVRTSICPRSRLPFFGKVFVPKEADNDCPIGANLMFHHFLVMFFWASPHARRSLITNDPTAMMQPVHLVAPSSPSRVRVAAALAAPIPEGSPTTRARKRGQHSAGEGERAALLQANSTSFLTVVRPATYGAIPGWAWGASDVGWGGSSHSASVPSTASLTVVSILLGLVCVGGVLTRPAPRPRLGSCSISTQQRAKGVTLGIFERNSDGGKCFGLKCVVLWPEVCRVACTDVT